MNSIWPCDQMLTDEGLNAMLAAPTAAPSTTDATASDALAFRLLHVNADDGTSGSSAQRGKLIEVRAFTVDGELASLRTAKHDTAKVSRFLEQVAPHSTSLKNVISTLLIRAQRHDVRGVQLHVLHPYEVAPREPRSVTIPSIVDLNIEWRERWPNPADVLARASFSRLVRLVELIANCSWRSRTTSSSGDLLASTEDCDVALRFSKWLDRLSAK